VPPGSGVFLRLLVGELWTPKLAQIFAYGKIFACGKTPFWEPFNAKPIIERAVRKWDVKGATKLKLYSYNGIGKYLGCVKIFTLGGVRRAQGP